MALSLHHSGRPIINGILAVHDLLYLLEGRTVLAAQVVQCWSVEGLLEELGCLVSVVRAFKDGV